MCSFKKTKQTKLMNNSLIIILIVFAIVFNNIHCRNLEKEQQVEVEKKNMSLDNALALIDVLQRMDPLSERLLFVRKFLIEQVNQALDKQCARCFRVITLFLVSFFK